MALDPRTGVWNPLCDIAGCLEDQAADGVVMVDVLVADEIRTARIRVCARHRDRCDQPAPQPRINA